MAEPPRIDRLTMLEGRTVLITGGTGSCGQALLRRLRESDIAEIRVFSRDEQKHFALARRFPDRRIRWIVGDVRDADSVRRAARGANVIIHAAAMKHVPLVEDNVHQACRTNIDGVWNVLRAAESEGAERVIAISTDKAVLPVNAMGMTKALQERLVCSYTATSSNLVCCCVRYGNVVASQGSVIPYFLDLLQRGKRVLPVTHPEMTRFLLTLDQAVDMVLYALAEGRSGQTIVSKIPSVGLVDLAEVMLAGFGGGSWEIAGIRPGEKLHETLVSAEELGRARDVTDEVNGHHYFVIDRGQHGDPISPRDPFTSETSERMSKEAIRALLISEGLVEGPTAEFGRLDR